MAEHLSTEGKFFFIQTEDGPNAPLRRVTRIQTADGEKDMCPLGGIEHLQPKISELTVDGSPLLILSIQGMKDAQILTIHFESEWPVEALPSTFRQGVYTLNEAKAQNEIYAACRRPTVSGGLPAVGFIAADPKPV